MSTCVIISYPNCHSAIEDAVSEPNAAAFIVASHSWNTVSRFRPHDATLEMDLTKPLAM